MNVGDSGCGTVQQIILTYYNACCILHHYCGKKN